MFLFFCRKNDVGEKRNLAVSASICSTGNASALGHVAWGVWMWLIGEILGVCVDRVGTA